MRTQRELNCEYAGRKVLVTGATGFIGTALIGRLTRQRARVVGLVHKAPPSITHPSLCWVHHDTSSLSEAHQLFADHQPEVVFHLAGTRGGRGSSHDRLQTAMWTNLTLTHNLLEAARAHSVQAFVQVGSSEEYGNVPVPFSEKQGVLPSSPYGVTKLAATLLAQEYAQACALNACTARVFMAYGPGQGLDFFLPQLIDAWGKGEVLKMSPGQQSRDFLWIDDCVEALLRLGCHNDLGGTIVNICTGVETQLGQVIDLLHRLTNREPLVDKGAFPYRDREMMRNVGDPGWLGQLTNYRPATSLEEGLQRMVGSGRWLH